MTKAYRELYSSDGIISELCKLGCDVMKNISNFTGFTYLEVNVFLLYIVQPIIYITYMISGIHMLIKKFNSKLLSLLYVIPFTFLYKLYRNYINCDFNTLGEIKINNIYNYAHASGLTYAEFNIIVFIVFFTFITIIHGNLLIFNKYINKYIYLFIFSFLTYFSHYFIFVFYT